MGGNLLTRFPITKKVIKVCCHFYLVKTDRVVNVKTNDNC